MGRRSFDYKPHAQHSGPVRAPACNVSNFRNPSCRTLTLTFKMTSSRRPRVLSSAARDLAWNVPPRPIALPRNDLLKRINKACYHVCGMIFPRSRHRTANLTFHLLHVPPATRRRNSAMIAKTICISSFFLIDVFPRATGSFGQIHIDRWLAPADVRKSGENGRADFESGVCDGGLVHGFSSNDCGCCIGEAKSVPGSNIWDESATNSGGDVPDWRELFEHCDAIG